ncbi:amidohydrolase family protein [Streptomyces sp. W16]|uniref:amidohydrolase family protein n=1 Tax=Streptomyces sp. W16 TaxID=3076631 RepID=UPI00295B1742|nr:amidohydrolase family protein [Streptomyces sp. W16]MDV9170732.1 amidohydrolase family protein [Streptomyces sp. W16]
MSYKPQARTLIRGATILSMDPDVGDLDRGDLLVEGSLISAVGPRLEVADVDEEIDGTGCVVVPGFVDTHRHMWEALLRGCAPHHTIDDYFGHFLCGTARNVSPRDVRLGTLLSARAALAAGVTTVQDISNIQDSPEHTDAAVEALRESGLRAVFGYGKSFVRMMSEGSRLPDDVRRVRSRLLSDDEALVTLALVTESGDDNAECHNHALARELGVRTARHVSADYPVTRLAKLGALLPGTTFIHGSGLDEQELRVIADSGGGLSIAPAVELMMGHGYPPLAPAAEAGLRISLSVDVEITAPCDMFTQMRAAYQAARHGQSSAGGTRSVTVRQILRYATLSGAQTLGLGDRVGSLTPGKQADLVVLRADRPDVAPVLDPYSTVVLQMDRSHVDTVLVAGRPVKRSGVDLSDSADLLTEAREAAERLLSLSARQGG